ncbi:MAG TPA: HyaD/HybD family hydrogenase maturation endopeptidase [Gemmatimonadales bacterium]|nr:HyaD/HybD family hydrogenase maturation endopeptidase [Gemmatimonadales bacterium]
MPMTCNATRTLVVGLGNPLMADDGVGLAILEALRDGYDLPSSVTLSDGGTWGMMLLPSIEDAEELLLLDAVRAGSPAGTLTQLGRDQLPLYFSHKISPHQIDLKEVLAVADLRGNLPARLTVIGVEPEAVLMRHSLSPGVAARVGDAVQAAVRQLAAWGHECVRRSAVVHA